MYSPIKRMSLKTEPFFRVEGQVTELFPGSGVATVSEAGQDEYSVNRGTEGIHFEDVRIGQTITCDVSWQTNRVTHAHQQTQPAQVTREMLLRRQ